MYAFAYGLYQLQSISILSSIFMTVVLALERYLAITKPIEYHNAIQGTNPWKRVWMYIIPVVIFSAIFNLPKFAETKVVPVFETTRRLALFFTFIILLFVHFSILTAEASLVNVPVFR